MTNPYNPKIPSIARAFGDVSTRGVKHAYEGEPAIPNMVESHVQGIAAYGHYFILTHNNKGYSRGYILVIDRSEQKLLYELETPDEHFNHPGGCQQIGDYLAVAVENSDHSKSFIHFYDLGGMTDARPPLPLPCRIERPHGGAGAVGITSFTNDAGVETYLVAAFDNGKLDLYLSNGYPLGSPRLAFERTQEHVKLHGDYSEICLVTQANQRIGLVGFQTEDLGGSNEDYADRYLLVRTGDSFTISDRRDHRHMHADHDGGVAGMAGVHYRWGAGLRVRDDGTLEFFAAQRNFVGGRILSNTFDTK